MSATVLGEAASGGGLRRRLRSCESPSNLTFKAQESLKLPETAAPASAAPLAESWPGVASDAQPRVVASSTEALEIPLPQRPERDAFALSYPAWDVEEEEEAPVADVQRKDSVGVFSEEENLWHIFDFLGFDDERAATVEMRKTERGQRPGDVDAIRAAKSVPGGAHRPLTLLGWVDNDELPGEDMKEDKKDKDGKRKSESSEGSVIFPDWFEDVE